MSNLQEVELRAFITNKQKEKIDKFLGQNFIKELYIKDVYFCKNDIKDFKDVEMDDVGSFSLRIRESKIGNKSINTINMKVITSFGDHHAWDEYEIIIDSVDEAWSIFRSLGYKDFFTLEKNRHTYVLDDMTVNLEDIVGEDSAIEVEIMANKQNADSAKKRIKKFLEQYDIFEDQIAKKSITNIVMHKRAKF